MVSGRVIRYSVFNKFGLAHDFSANQFSADDDGSFRVLRTRLCSPYSRIGRCIWSCCEQDATVTLQHCESHVLIRQPTNGCQRNHAVGADDNYSAQTMMHTW